jgi:hypothetical protein
MALPNRVQPDGVFLADPARGGFTGNRGCLVGADGQFGRARWKGKAWITCTLRVNPAWGRHPVSAPRRWTPLFFHDEAVAVAAGHRPCATCRRTAFDGFKAAWAGVFGAALAPEIDACLHGARLQGRAQRRFQAQAVDLPEGAFFHWQGQAHLVRGGGALPYTPGGYGVAVALPRADVSVLTPEPMVRLLSAGWQPVYDAGLDRPRWG